MKWTAIVVSCPYKEWTHPLQRELEIRQAKGYIDKDVFLLTVEDPKQGVGSGGATINALLTVTEYISAQRGFTVINPDVLSDSHILVIHHGRTYPYDSCGRPFVTLPIKTKHTDFDGLLCMFDVMLKSMTEKLAAKSAPGMWVCSSDMILSIPHDADIDWSECDAGAITVPADPEYCKGHGVYKIDQKGYVEDIFFRESLQKLAACQRPDGSVLVVPGIVYFSVPVVESLLQFFAKPPLDACTYFGVDSGEPPIQLSLFFDVMLSMSSQVDELDFVSGERSGAYGKKSTSSDVNKTMKAARSILWKNLHRYTIKTCLVESGSFLYPYTVEEHRKNILQQIMRPCFNEEEFQWSNITNSYIERQCHIDKSSCIINSYIQGSVQVDSSSIISHSTLDGNIHIGRDSFISGLSIDLSQRRQTVVFANCMVVQGYNMYLPTLGTDKYVLTTHGTLDDVQMPAGKETATFCNESWPVFLQRTGITNEDLWDTGLQPNDQTIMTAKIFPVFHATENIGLPEILWLQGQIHDDSREHLKRWRSSWRLSLGEILPFVNIGQEFDSRRRLFYEVSKKEIEMTLKQQENKGFIKLYNTAVVEGYTDDILKTLDSVAVEHSTSVKAGIAARVLGNIADVLGCMAGPKGGLRSGPAANDSWSKAFLLLESHNIPVGVEALAKERRKWLDRPDKLIRAARHYEGAAAILIRQAVMTAKEYFKTEKGTVAEMGKWVLAECPARIDVSGGWSDTPPITYEHGGAVVTIGLLINGKRPIGAKARRIKEPHIKIVIHGETEEQHVLCQELPDLEDYYQPHSPGALLKAAFVCAEMVDLKSTYSLEEQLMQKYGGGFEIHSWTNLPHGSGLGTSSILAGAVMASLLRAAGIRYDVKGLIHAVLYLEQLLTTGGGWQDQVGGLFGGIKLGTSAGTLPLLVEPLDVKVSAETIQQFNDRLVLIYTGKTRLAKNILQEVVRNWYARNPKILETEDNLVALAKECAQAFVDGDLQAVGSCLDRYWIMKKLMSPGCEPEFLVTIMKALRPYSLGICMAGAGGGGFMYVLAKDKENKELIKASLPKVEDMKGTQVYDAVVDIGGLQVSIVEDAS